jgi:hypothetical protein
MGKLPRQSFTYVHRKKHSLKQLRSHFKCDLPVGVLDSQANFPLKRLAENG